MSICLSICLSVRLSICLFVCLSLSLCLSSTLRTDTEGSFIVERVVEVATAAVEHLKHMAETSNDEGLMSSITIRN